MLPASDCVFEPSINVVVKIRQDVISIAVRDMVSKKAVASIPYFIRAPTGQNPILPFSAYEDVVSHSHLR